MIRSSSEKYCWCLLEHEKKGENQFDVNSESAKYEIEFSYVIRFRFRCLISWTNMYVHSSDPRILRYSNNKQDTSSYTEPWPSATFFVVFSFVFVVVVIVASLPHYHVKCFMLNWKIVVTAQPAESMLN